MKLSINRGPGQEGVISWWFVVPCYIFRFVTKPCSHIYFGVVTRVVTGGDDGLWLNEWDVFDNGCGGCATQV